MAGGYRCSSSVTYADGGTMRGMGDAWQDKDDLDLTNDDLDAMMDEGKPIAVNDPTWLAGGVWFDPARAHMTPPPSTSAVPTFGATAAQFDRRDVLTRA